MLLIHAVLSSIFIFPHKESLRTPLQHNKQKSPVSDLKTVAVHKALGTHIDSRKAIFYSYKNPVRLTKTAKDK